MTSNELTKKFLAWWQPLNPNSRLWPNRTGFFISIDGKRKIPCGIPPPIPGRKNTGGGSDLIGISATGIWIAREIKTINDTLKKHQADFLSLVKSRGGDAALVWENPLNQLGFDEIIWTENMRYLIK
jgi:hypothetical protein